MRETGVNHGLLVINNPGGICQGGDGGVGCQDVLQLVLPPGATLAVWTPLEMKAGQQAVTFVGSAR